MKLNTLNFAQKYKVGQWMEKNRATILHVRPSLETLAEQATKDLGFAVTARNIKGVREMIGLNWIATRVYVPKPNVQANKNNGRIGACENRVRQLRQLIATIYEELGKKSEVLEDLMNY